MDLNDRVSYEIIEEVTNKLFEEGIPYDLDRDLINSIQKDWVINLETLKKEPKKTVIPLEESDSLGSDYSEEEKLTQLENSITAYMVCFYTKVNRSKIKLKCNFKNGFINMDNEDIPFSNATGELILW